MYCTREKRRLLTPVLSLSLLSFSSCLSPSVLESDASRRSVALSLVAQKARARGADRWWCARYVMIGLDGSFSASSRHEKEENRAENSLFALGRLRRSARLTYLIMRLKSGSRRGIKPAEGGRGRKSRLVTKEDHFIFIIQRYKERTRALSGILCCNARQKWVTANISRSDYSSLFFFVGFMCRYECADSQAGFMVLICEIKNRDFSKYRKMFAPRSRIIFSKVLMFFGEWHEATENKK